VRVYVITFDGSPCGVYASRKLADDVAQGYREENEENVKKQNDYVHEYDVIALTVKRKRVRRKKP
jgi:hypothetical protein